MKIGGILIILTLSFSTLAVWANPYRRQVSFEWEAIENAKYYELELKQANPEEASEKPFNFKSKEAMWSGQLPPGKYLMKLRSVDYRGVPGDWSEQSEFKVDLEVAILKFPTQKMKIQTTDSEDSSVEFAWNPVGGADKYQFILSSENGKTQITEDLTDPSFKVTLPVATNYTWKVTASDNKGVTSEATSIGEFSLIGKVLEKPEIEAPETEFVRQIKWSRPEFADNFDVYVLRYSVEKKKWEKVQVFENYKQDFVTFDEKWPGGKYQTIVRAKGDLRAPSPQAKSSFAVRHGDRSPAAEYTASVRKSIDRTTGWYGIASYLITEMQYHGLNPENNSSVAYNAIGGTGRLGLGWAAPSSPWGFLGIVDMSGFTFNNKTQTFASAELNAVYRRSIGERGELRIPMGPYYKELPETVGDPLSGQSLDLKITSAGPHVGAEYWYSLTPKIGIQVNAHAYMSMLKISTPNGEALSPKLSTQFGLLGSYRITPRITGLIGYAIREDKMSYNAVPSSDNFASAGDVNESTIIGNYLNLFAEWSF